MAVSPIPRDEVARLAYLLWQRRGCPPGSPEIDWRKAEEQLMQRTAAGAQNAPTPFSQGWNIIQDQRRREAS
jgi:hypothetical protein